MYSYNTTTYFVRTNTRSQTIKHNATVIIIIYYTIKSKSERLLQFYNVQRQDIYIPSYNPHYTNMYRHIKFEQVGAVGLVVNTKQR